uniref:Uncharacterized protein n=1 Tax=Arundo donax TaxID=35708 RepID=A0A0A9DI23_ARUDO
MQRRMGQGYFFSSCYSQLLMSAFEFALSILVHSFHVPLSQGITY